jgi:ABC-type amino acid transport substrate-binding protein
MGFGWNTCEGKNMSDRRGFVIALGAGTLAIPFFSYAQQQSKVWRIGYAPFASPLQILPGATLENYKALDANTAQGAMIEVLKAIAKDAGAQVQFQALVAGDLFVAIDAGRIDIRTVALSNMDQKFMDISDPIFNDSEVLIAHKNDNTSYTSYNDLKGVVIGARSGTVSENDLKANGLDIKSYASAPELFKAVDTGEVKVAINTTYIVVLCQT